MSTARLYRRSRSKRPLRVAQSMLELVAATTVISIALVPALRLTRDSLVRMNELELHEEALSFCTGKIEQQLALTAATWNLNDEEGDFSADGRSELHFQVTKSDALDDGGSPDSLAVIRVIVWNDEDGGNDLDAEELRIQLDAKVAKLLAYEYEATVH